VAQFEDFPVRGHPYVLLRYLIVHKLGAVLFESLLLLICVLVDAVPREPSGLLNYFVAFGRALVFAGTFQIVLHLWDFYDFGAKLRLKNIIRLAQGLLMASAVVATLHFALPSLVLGPGKVMIVLLRASVCLTIWRAVLWIYFAHFTDRSNVLIMGTGKLARALATEIIDRPELGLAVCGFIDDKPELVGISIVNPKVLGLTKDVRQIISKGPVKKIAVELEDRRGRLPIDELLELKIRGVQIEEATSLYERLTGKIAIENLKPSWMIFNEGFQVSRRILVKKQIVSTVVSVALLLFSLPLLPFIALLIKLDSRGPVFHRQQRVGQDGKTFTLWKFRSMYQDAERATGPVWASAGDSRITRVGKCLRRTRLDELPQLYNVLKGDMSLVGPRPERPHFVEQLSEVIPYYHLRHSVKPGVTGWAQINYRYGSSLEDAIEKLQYELFYIKNMSFWLDAVIIVDTVKTVLVRKGS
jgi:sugar transferase (PEP-CTERM system associated)